MFINVALTKITDLVKREDFKSIAFIDDKNVTILFENKCCNINSFGRVTWDEDEETETTWLKDSNTKLNQPTVSKPVEAGVSGDELKIICDTVVDLARIRQEGCNHLCVENFAQQCLGQLLTELQLNKQGKLRIFNTEIESN